jgi:hypothetical protein
LKKLTKIIVFLGVIAGFFFLADYTFHFLDLSPVDGEVNITPNTFQNGVYKEYYGDSAIKTSTEYVGGIRHGRSMNYYTNGMLQEVSYYISDVKTGKSYHFSENGNLALVKTYYKDSLLFEMIVNDSVYKYEYNAVQYGMILYDDNCSSCHAEFHSGLSQKLRKKWEALDSSVTTLNVAEFHSYELDTLASGSLEYYGVEFDSSIVLSKPDILAILDFFRADSGRVKRYPIMKKLRVNSPKI